MFVQIIEGDVADPQRLQQQFERWSSELRPGAPGFLGATEGITDDGHFIALACFDSAEAAQANSQRPEQDEWWRETVACFREAPKLTDTTETDMMLDGPSQEAGFVQIMQGGPADHDKVHELDEASIPLLQQQRPDIIGGLRAWHPDGRFTEAVYFTDEESARAAESQPMPEEMQALWEEELKETGELTYLDLHEPWIVA